MIDYSKGKVYAIRCNKTNLQYIGSTVLDLEERLKRHMTNYAQFLKGNYSYCWANKILEGGDFGIVLLEAYPCKSKKELTMREGHYQRTTECINHRKEIVFRNTDPLWYKHRVTCGCGKQYNYSNKNMHERTQHHRDWVASVIADHANQNTVV